MRRHFSFLYIFIGIVLISGILAVSCKRDVEILTPSLYSEPSPVHLGLDLTAVLTRTGQKPVSDTLGSGCGFVEGRTVKSFSFLPETKSSIVHSLPSSLPCRIYYYDSGWVYAGEDEDAGDTVSYDSSSMTWTTAGSYNLDGKKIRIVICSDCESFDEQEATLRWASETTLDEYDPYGAWKDVDSYDRNSTATVVLNHLCAAVSFTFNGEGPSGLVVKGLRFGGMPVGDVVYDSTAADPFSGASANTGGQLSYTHDFAIIPGASAAIMGNGNYFLLIPGRSMPLYIDISYGGQNYTLSREFAVDELTAGYIYDYKVSFASFSEMDPYITLLKTEDDVDCNPQTVAVSYDTNINVGGDWEADSVDASVDPEFRLLRVEVPGNLYGTDRQLPATGGYRVRFGGPEGSPVAPWVYSDNSLIIRQSGTSVAMGPDSGDMVEFASSVAVNPAGESFPDAWLRSTYNSETLSATVIGPWITLASDNLDAQGLRLSALTFAPNTGSMSRTGTIRVFGSQSGQAPYSVSKLYTFTQAPQSGQGYRLTVTQPSAPIHVGETFTPEVRLYTDEYVGGILVTTDSVGSVVPGSDCSWTPASPGIVSVASDGTATGESSGRITVTVTYIAPDGSELSASYELDVLRYAYRLRIFPDSAVVTTGESAVFSFRLYADDYLGNTLYQSNVFNGPLSGGHNGVSPSTCVYVNSVPAVAGMAFGDGSNGGTFPDIVVTGLSEGSSQVGIECRDFLAADGSYVRAVASFVDEPVIEYFYRLAMDQWEYAIAVGDTQPLPMHLFRDEYHDGVLYASDPTGSQAAWNEYDYSLDTPDGASVQFAGGAATGVAAGTVYAHATAKAGTGYIAFGGGYVTTTTTILISDTVTYSYSLVLTPAEASVETGSTQDYSVELVTNKYVNGTLSQTTSTPLSPEDCSWESSRPDRATVSGGTATGVTVGSTVITASYVAPDSSTVSAAADLAVTPAYSYRYRLSISPVSAILYEWESGGTTADHYQDYVVTLHKDRYLGSSLDAFDYESQVLANASCSWASSDPSVASVTTGTAQGLVSGVTTITATYSAPDGTSPQASSELTVKPVRETRYYLSYQDNPASTSPDVTFAPFETTVNASQNPDGVWITSVINSYSPRVYMYSAQYVYGVLNSSVSRTELTLAERRSAVCIWTSYDTSVGYFAASGNSRCVLQFNFNALPGSVLISTDYPSPDGNGTLHCEGIVHVNLYTYKFIRFYVNPPLRSISVGEVAEYQANIDYVRYLNSVSQGQIVGTVQNAAWQSGNSAIGTSEGDGYFTGVSGGSTSVSATYNDGHGTVLSDVAALEVVDNRTRTYSYSLQLTPANASILVGQTQAYTAMLTTEVYVDGTLEDTYVSDVSGSCDYTLSNSTIASVSSNIATGLKAGFTNISARHMSTNTSSNTVRLNVSNNPDLATYEYEYALRIDPLVSTIPVGGTQSYRAFLTKTVYECFDGVRSGVYTVEPESDVTYSCSFTSRNTGIATMNLVRANGVSGGVANIYATHTATGTVSGDAQLTVSDNISYSLIITPPTAFVGVGGTQDYTATLYTTVNGVTDSGRDVSAESVFTSRQNSIATMSGRTATGVSGGVANIYAMHAASGTTSDDAQLNVTNDISYSLIITPPTASVAVGGTQDYTATLYTTVNGVSDGGRDVTAASVFTSRQTGIASMSGRTATGVSGGTANIYAAHTATGTVSGDATLTVSEPVSSYYLVISPSPGKVYVGEHTIYDESKVTYDGYSVKLYKNQGGVNSFVMDVPRASCTWSSSASAKATVSAGVVTGVSETAKNEYVTISASYAYDGKTAGGTAKLAVRRRVNDGWTTDDVPVEN